MRSLRGRLLAMGSAHDAMRHAEALGKGRTGQLLEGLAEAIGSALGEEGELVTEIEDHEITHEVLLPLALVLNELLTNALKYGRSASGKIAVAFRLNGGTYELEVRDSGPGFPDGQAASNSSGLSFIKALTRQMNGQFVARNDNGAICSVTFPA